MGVSRTVVSRFNDCKTTRLACTNAEGKVEVRPSRALALSAYPLAMSA